VNYFGALACRELRGRATIGIHIVRTNIVIDDKLMRDTRNGSEDQARGRGRGALNPAAPEKTGGDPSAPRKAGVACRSKRDEARQLMSTQRVDRLFQGDDHGADRETRQSTWPRAFGHR